MSDERSRRGPRDRTQVELEEEADVRYWTEELGVTEEELRNAVHTAGIQIDDVRQHLRRSRG